MAALSLVSWLFTPIAGSNTAGSGPQQNAPSNILKAAAENGRRIIESLKEYTYYAELTIETVSGADVITGKFYRFSQVRFDENGKPHDRVFEEKSTLPEDVHIGSNAVNNLTSVYRFIVTPQTHDQYEFDFVGREKIDEINTFVFDVRPKVRLPNPEKTSERYLKGRVWIDDQDLQVVKVAGEALPEQRAHRTPRFETYFQNYGQFWFPAYTNADDSIRVGRGHTRVIVNVRFTGYKRAAGN